MHIWSKVYIFANIFRRFPNLFFFSSRPSFLLFPHPPTIPHKLRLKEDPPPTPFLFSLSFSRIFFFFPLPIPGEKKCRRIKKRRRRKRGKGGRGDNRGCCYWVGERFAKRKIFTPFFTVLLPRSTVLFWKKLFPSHTSETAPNIVEFHIMGMLLHMPLSFSPSSSVKRKKVPIHKKVQKQVSNFFFYYQIFLFILRGIVFHL